MKVKYKVENLLGLFDFDSFEELVSSLNVVLERGKSEIVPTLFFEAVETGTTVRQAAEEYGVTPHVHDEVMERFYSETDAFVFELVVGHIRDACKEIDRRVIEAVDRFGEGGRMLCLGDGIGTDALRFAKAGFSVTYFEFDGPSSRFAQHRFSRAGVEDEIEVVHQLEEIPYDEYDVVVNREVLEHVYDPPQVIDDIWEYLRKEGIAVVTESFSRVDEKFPTHLASNEKYAGKTDLLFVRIGFSLLKIYPQWRPLVVRKTGKMVHSRYTSLLTKHRIKDAARRVGRAALNGFRGWIAFRSE